MAQPTAALQDAIQSLHQAITDETDPKHMATLGQCLTQMMKVQAEIMQGGGAQGGNGQASAGNGGGSPPAGPQTAADPQLAALLSGMGGQGGY